MGSLQKHQNQSSHSLINHVVNPFLTIQKEVDKALHGFYDLFEHKPFNLTEIENMVLAPSMDLVEEKDCYKIMAEMPGMDEKDIRVTLNDNLLTVHGEKTTSKKSDRKHFISREINYGQYERSISLPKAADGDRTTASFEKGILCITIPKKSGSIERAREIKIQKS